MSSVFPFAQAVRNNSGTIDLLKTLVATMSGCRELATAEARWARRVIKLIKDNGVPVRPALKEMADELKAIANGVITLLNQQSLTSPEDSWYRIAVSLSELWDSSGGVGVEDYAEDYLSSI